MSKIRVVNRYGDPRKLASREDPQHTPASFGPTQPNDRAPHGLTPAEIQDLHRKFEALQPGLSRAGDNRRQVVQELLDVSVPGATLYPRTRRQGQLFGSSSMPGIGGNSTFITPQRPYQPEFESPDRQQYPIHRLLANRYWRLFYKMDPLVGTCIDMIGELVWSEFKLTGEGVDGEVKARMEEMCEETQFRAVLPFLVKEFLVVGEACPHLYWDEDKKLWTHIALHNPDQLEIIYSPFVKMDPVAEFVPDDRLRQVVTSPNPQLRRIREMMPPELIAKLSSRQNIALNPINFTFIPRKLHPYDVRGTSILSRLWRVFMAEDALWNSFIATARRAASPLKVAKIGDASTNFIPGPEQEKKLQTLLAQAELDPQAWLVWHYGINFELAGAPERVMAINNNYDLIERIKLIALGISKSFLTGEVTYASAAAGLTVFLQRLLVLREFFESVWIYPKFFRQCAVMNDWILPTEAELSHRVRTKRSKRELIENKRYIIPVIEWEKSLDPAANTERINALQALRQLGIGVSRRTALSTVGLDLEQELKQIVQEQKTIKDIIKNDMYAAAAAGVQIPGMAPPVAPGAEGEGGGGGAGMAVSPGLPEGSLGEFGPPGAEVVENAPPGGAPGGEGTVPLTPGAAKSGEEGAPDTVPEKEVPIQSIWQPELTKSLMALFEDFDHAQLDEPWDRMLMDSEAARNAIKLEEPHLLWEAVEQWLLNEGYPTRAITDLEDLLVNKGKIVRASINRSGQALPNGTNEDELIARIETQVLGQTGLSADTSLFTGVK